MELVNIVTGESFIHIGFKGLGMASDYNFEYRNREESKNWIKSCLRRIHIRKVLIKELGLTQWEIGFILKGYSLEEARHYCRAYGKPTTEGKV